MRVILRGSFCMFNFNWGCLARTHGRARIARSPAPIRIEFFSRLCTCRLLLSVVCLCLFGCRYCRGKWLAEHAQISEIFGTRVGGREYARARKLPFWSERGLEHTFVLRNWIK